MRTSGNGSSSPDGTPSSGNSLIATRALSCRRKRSRCSAVPMYGRKKMRPRHHLAKKNPRSPISHPLHCIGILLNFDLCVAGVTAPHPPQTHASRCSGHWADRIHDRPQLHDLPQYKDWPISTNSVRLPPPHSRWDRSPAWHRHCCWTALDRCARRASISSLIPPALL